ncbi:MAG: hypothetical protein IPG97_18530 [Microthrixaceae bacterium]|nr:hypothetical protein [Microthrixaceae bacterium]
MTVSSKRPNRATSDDELAALGVDLLGIFGSTAARESAQVPDTEPHDLDVAARFNGPVRLLELIDLLVRTTGFDRVDVAVVDGNHPVLDAEAPVASCSTNTPRGVRRSPDGGVVTPSHTAFGDD